MDTNKENELLLNLDKQTPPAVGAAANHLADGRPLTSDAEWAAVNHVTADLVNKIEAYGAEAVYNATAEDGDNEKNN